MDLYVSYNRYIVGRYFIFSYYIHCQTYDLNYIVIYMNIEKFKYTTNKDRKIFSSFLKQHIGDITDLVLEMPWDSYEYKGPCILSQTTEDEEQIYTPTEIIAKCYDLPYHL